MINVSGYEQDNDLIFVALPYGSYVIVGLDSKPTYFEVMYHSNPYKGIPPGFSGVVVDRCDLGFIYSVTRKQVISHFENIETGERLNIVQFTKRKAELLKCCTIGEENQYVFPTVRDRVEYELFLELFAPSYFTPEQLIKVEVTIQGKLETPTSEFISPVRKVTGDLTNTMYILYIGKYIASVVSDFLLSKGYSKADGDKEDQNSFSISDRFGYSKIGSSYITIQINKLKKFENYTLTSTVSDTLPRLEAKIEQLHKEITDAMTIWWNLKTFRNLDENNLLKIKDSVKTLLEIHIEPKAAYTKKYSALRKEIVDLVKTVDDAIISLDPS